MEARRRAMIDEDWNVAPKSSLRNPTSLVAFHVEDVHIAGVDDTEDQTSPHDTEGHHAVPQGEQPFSPHNAVTIMASEDTNVPDAPVQPYPITTKGWTLQGLMEEGRRFKPVPRISASSPPEEILKAIEDHEKLAEPLVISGWHELPEWRGDLFTPKWLLEKATMEGGLSVRNCVTRQDKMMMLDDFIEYCQGCGPYAVDGEKERLYGKDVACPMEWEKWIESGPLPDAVKPNGCNDLFQYFPKNGGVETLMCYLGVGDTFTPAHKDLCASSGQNLMCYTESDGSSFWFMTKGADSSKASQFFQTFGHELDHETKVVSPAEFAQAPFDVFITEQKLGDLVLVPRRSCHQVVNFGGLTIKSSWSRMTIEGLITAYHHELPIYRRVCRPETYRIKALCYHSVIHYTAALKSLAGIHPVDEGDIQTEPPISPGQLANLTEKLRSLLGLLTSILKEEHPGQKQLPPECVGSNQDSTEGEMVSPGTCDFCGADIFRSFFECKSCVDSSGDGVIICPGCYVEGRVCSCMGMEPHMSEPFERLTEKVKEAEQALRAAGVEYKYDKENEHLPIFEAALLLRHKRQDISRKQQTLACKPFKGQLSHPEYWISVLQCRSCHHNKCFKHLLEVGIHVSDAIVQHSLSDAGHDFWHKFHQERRKQFLANKSGAIIAEEKGTPYEACYTWVLKAQTYATCFPVNAQISAGWYDNISLERVVDEGSEMEMEMDIHETNAEPVECCGGDHAAARGGDPCMEGVEESRGDSLRTTDPAMSPMSELSSLGDSDEEYECNQHPKKASTAKLPRLKAYVEISQPVPRRSTPLVPQPAPRAKRRSNKRAHSVESEDYQPRPSPGSRIRRWRIDSPHPQSTPTTLRSSPLPVILPVDNQDTRHMSQEPPSPRFGPKGVVRRMKKKQRIGGDAPGVVIPERHPHAPSRINLQHKAIEPFNPRKLDETPPPNRKVKRGKVRAEPVPQTQQHASKKAHPTSQGSSMQPSRLNPFPVRPTSVSRPPADRAPENPLLPSQNLGLGVQLQDPPSSNALGLDFISSAQDFDPRLIAMIQDIVKSSQVATVTAQDSSVRRIVREEIRKEHERPRGSTSVSSIQRLAQDLKNADLKRSDQMSKMETKVSDILTRLERAEHEIQRALNQRDQRISMLEDTIHHLREMSSRPQPSTSVQPIVVNVPQPVPTSPDNRNMNHGYQPGPWFHHNRSRPPIRPQSAFTSTHLRHRSDLGPRQFQRHPGTWGRDQPEWPPRLERASYPPPVQDPRVNRDDNTAAVAPPQSERPMPARVETTPKNPQNQLIQTNGPMQQPEATPEELDEQEGYLDNYAEDLNEPPPPTLQKQPLSCASPRTPGTPIVPPISRSNVSLTGTLIVPFTEDNPWN